jgi:hypothetical protein
MTTETVKLILEGDPGLVEATAVRLKQFFTVTYESKNQRLSHRPHEYRRYLRLLPPDLAHTEHSLERSEPMP